MDNSPSTPLNTTPTEGAYKKSDIVPQNKKPSIKKIALIVFVAIVVVVSLWAICYVIKGSLIKNDQTAIKELSAEEYLSYCDKELDLNLRGHCYANVGIAKQDISICEKIDAEKNMTWRSHCFGRIGIKTLDVSLCEKSEFDDRYNCYSAIAKSEKDVSICKNADVTLHEINKEPVFSTSDTCRRGVYDVIAQAGGDVAMCDTEGENKNSCYERFALVKNDITLCDNLLDTLFFDSSGITRNSCKYDVAYKIAKETHNLSFCDSDLVGVARKNSCYLEFAIDNENTTLCSKIAQVGMPGTAEYYMSSTDRWHRNYCYGEVAKKKQDISVCNLIEIQGEIGIDQSAVRDQQWCYVYVAKRKQDLSICKNDYVAWKAQCYNHVAEGKKDVTMCDNIPSVLKFDSPNDYKVAQDECYMSVAASKKDLSICEKFSNEEEQASCYSALISYYLFN